MSSLSYQPADIARREWWVVGATFLVALIVGTVLAAGGKAIYSGDAGVDINAATIGRNPGLATPTQVQQAVLSTSSQRRVASATGVTAADLRANAKAFLTGSPPTLLTVTYASSDRAQARAVASAMQAEALKEAVRLSAREIARAKALVAQTETTLRNMPTTAGVADPSRQADLEYQRWNVGIQLTGFKSNLESLEEAYMAAGPASVAQQSAIVTGGKTLVAVALLGLVFGLIIAGIREGLLRRGSSS